ncbi:MAG: TolC family protein, partial [Pseudomonadota bacterium]|nr:TolC family protein [Pseudomonadota bacterium]
MIFTPHPSLSRLKLPLLAAFLLLLGGCATLSRDGGFGAVANVAKERLAKDAQWVRSESDADGVQAIVKKLLAQPLTVDDAIQVALLNNRGLQATYAELGIAEADLVQASRLRNPVFGYTNVRGGGAQKIERSLGFDFLQFLTIPLAKRIESRRLEQTKLLVANEVLRIAAETRKAYFQAVAAQQNVLYAEQVKTAAEASAQLAERMARVGNFSKLDQAREQVFYADAAAQFARAQQMAKSEREKLTRFMGLWGEYTRFQLPERLPALPATPPELQDLEAFAMAERLDIQAARRQSEALASSLGLTKATRFINVLELGPAQIRETSEPVRNGFQISLEVPLFDWGGARIARSEAIYMQSVNRLAETAVNARSEVRTTYSDYIVTYDLAKHYRDEVVPLRKKISDELLLRYNGMLASVFELLADSREQVASVN